VTQGKLKRIYHSDEARSQIVDAVTGEDIGANFTEVGPGGCVLYPDDVAKQIVRDVNTKEGLLQSIKDLKVQLKRQAHPRQVTPIDLTAVSRNSKQVFTHIHFKDSYLKGLFHGTPWLKFGECHITTVEASGASFIRGFIRSGVTDGDHSSCYVAHIGLIGLQYKYTHNHVSHFEAYITPNPDNVLVYPFGWTPEAEESVTCTRVGCDSHQMIERFVPPPYEFVDAVAGKWISITIGPRWDLKT